MFIRASFQIRVVSQEVRLNASQLDELYNLFKVSQSLPIPVTSWFRNLVLVLMLLSMLSFAVRF